MVSLLGMDPAPTLREEGVPSGMDFRTQDMLGGFGRANSQWVPRHCKHLMIHLASLAEMGTKTRMGGSIFHACKLIH